MPILYDNWWYNSVEHAYQAAKTLDPKERDRIREALSPGLAKQAGRKVTLRPGWLGMRVEVMDDLLRQKFSKEPLRGWLIGTDPQELVEGNTWGDEFWGVNLRTGQGKNHLGRLLMAIREGLEKEKVN